MSRYYGMNVTISGHNPALAEAIQAAAGEEWPFDWTESDEQLTAYAEDNLCGGESEELFTERLSVAVWRANGAFCDVTVDATYLESLPYETHRLDESDYSRLINTRRTTLRTTLTIDVNYDPAVTDPESLASAADRLFETVLSTPGIMDEYANPSFGEFSVLSSSTEAAPDSSGTLRRWVLYDLDTDALLGTKVYTDHDEAVEDATQANDILVLPLVIQGIDTVNQGEEPGNE